MVISHRGHPSDIDNMQLAHWMCNRQKSDHLPGEMTTGGRVSKEKQEEINNRNLPQSFDWVNYRS